MAEYEEGWSYPVAFPPSHPAVTLPRVIAGQGKRQLHVAETEKYAHVTYFFNGGNEEACDGRATRAGPVEPRRADLRPRARDEAPPRPPQAFAEAWREDEPAFGIINFANADMVGHTGVIEAAVKAIETVDGGLGRSSPRSTSPAARA